MQNKVLSLLGLSTKAGRTVSGEFSTEKAVKEKKAFIVIVAEDASENTKKLFRDKCAFYHIPEYEYATKEQLGRAVGKEMRASVAVTDSGLAGKIEQELKIMEE